MEAKVSSAKYKYAGNPRKKASFLSQLLYCWVVPLLRKGYGKNLEEDDLFEPLDEHRSSGLGDKLEDAWEKECFRSGENPSLWRALAKVFGLEFGLYGLCLFFVEGCKLCQPIFLGHLLAYFRPGQYSVNKSSAVMYAALILVGSSLGILAGHAQMFGLQQIGMKVRVACCSLIYRKSLRLSRKAMGAATVGKAINLLSNDVNRFDFAVINIHNLWFVPIEIVVISCLLCHFTGWTALVGVGFLILYLPMQMFLSKRFSMLRSKTATKTDERVRLMNEIITGIQVIKMYAWEVPFSKLVDLARRTEIRYVRKTSYINGILSSLAIFSTRFTLFITLLTYVLLGNSLTPEHVFVTYSFFHMLRQCLTIYFAQGISNYSETKISVARIRTFLLYDEVQRFTDEQQKKSSSILKYKNVLQVKQATATWSAESLTHTLSNINFEANDGELIAVIGTVASGKSSLLQLILRELPLKSGAMDCHGTISYAAQEPWLFGATVRQNILFGEEFRKQKYDDVIQACALEQDLNSFPFGDKSLVGERGIMVSGGQKARISLARAIYKDADIYLLDDPLSAVDAKVGQTLFDSCIRTHLKDKCVILVTHQLQYLKNVNNIVLMDNGQIIGQGNYKEIQGLSFDLSKFMTFEEHENKEEGDEERMHVEAVIDHKKEQKEHAEIRPTGNIEDSVYLTYIKSMGTYSLTAIILSFFLLAQIAASGSDYYLTYWIGYEQNLQHQHLINSTSTGNISSVPRSTHVIIYSVIIISIIVFALSRSIGFFFLSTVASVNLHKNMFGALVKSPMSFFHQNASGRILNRFSKDVGSLDQMLPGVLADSVGIGLNALGVSLLVGIVNPWFFLVSSSMLILFYYMRKVYLETSRDLKRLETTTRSPVFKHIAESLQGLTTIRAFKAQTVLKDEFDGHQDAHSSAWYMFLATSKIFGFYLDVVCVLYVAVVTISLVLIDSLSTGEKVGLAITQATTLTGMFQWGMRQWSELVNQMTSVERVVEFTKLPKEPDNERFPIAEDWPSNGRIEFKNLSLRYAGSDQNALNDLNFIVEAQDKIGVVGRTGAGKTSLITALFRLAETRGDILIDGVNIGNLSLSDMRSKLSIIPQEPVLFSGTLRKNLDPFDEFEDVDLWNSLEEVELKKTFCDLPSGLTEMLLQGGTNFSVGQRQLICLARAILRQNKIIILDEATSNVDAHTDNLIQTTIRKKFADCTVITIAHRLNTIKDSDKVLVMQNGCVKEFDSPEALRKIENGAFSAILAESEGKKHAD